MPLAMRLVFESLSPLRQRVIKGAHFQDAIDTVQNRSSLNNKDRAFPLYIFIFTSPCPSPVLEFLNNLWGLGLGNE